LKCTLFWLAPKTGYNSAPPAPLLNPSSVGETNQNSAADKVSLAPLQRKKLQRNSAAEMWMKVSKEWLKRLDLSAGRHSFSSNKHEKGE